MGTASKEKMNSWQFSDSSAERYHRIALAEDEWLFLHDDC